MIRGIGKRKSPELHPREKAVPGEEKNRPGCSEIVCFAGICGDEEAPKGRKNNTPER